MTEPLQQTGFFGHPRGLSTLFFTEMWERFSFYGMKAMLFLFIIEEISEGPQSGLGIGAEVGGAIAGLYNSFVYLLALPGGWLADRLIGQRRAVLYGGIIIACGHYCMAVPGVLHSGELFFFYAGLILIIIGTGLLKPNISTMVGELYAGDMGARRDAGFSIFYMGINLGAWIAPIACGSAQDSEPPSARSPSRKGTGSKVASLAASRDEAKRTNVPPALIQARSLSPVSGGRLPVSVSTIIETRRSMRPAIASLVLAVAGRRMSARPASARST